MKTNKEILFFPQRIVHLATGEVFDGYEKESLRQGLADKSKKFETTDKAKKFLKQNIEDARTQIKDQEDAEIEQKADLRLHELAQEIDQKLEGANMDEQKMNVVRDIAFKLEKLLEYKVTIIDKKDNIDELGRKVDDPKEQAIPHVEDLRNWKPTPEIRPLFDVIDSASVDWRHNSFWKDNSIMNWDYSEAETYLKTKIMDLFAGEEAKKIISDPARVPKYQNIITNYLDKNDSNWSLGQFDQQHCNILLNSLNDELKNDIETAKYREQIKADQKFLENMVKFLPANPPLERKNVNYVITRDADRCLLRGKDDYQKTFENSKKDLQTEVNSLITDLQKKLGDNEYKIPKQGSNPNSIIDDINNLSRPPAITDPAWEIKALEAAQKWQDLNGKLDQEISAYETTAAGRLEAVKKYNEQTANILQQLKEDKVTIGEATSALEAQKQKLAAETEFPGTAELLASMQGIIDLLSKVGDQDQKISKLEGDKTGLEQKITQLESDLIKSREELDKKQKAAEQKEPAVEGKAAGPAEGKKSKAGKGTEGSEKPQGEKPKKPGEKAKTWVDNIAPNWPDRKEVDLSSLTTKPAEGKAAENLQTGQLYRLATKESSFAIRNEDGKPIGTLPKGEICQIIEEKAYQVIRSDKPGSYFTYVKICYNPSGDYAEAQKKPTYRFGPRGMPIAVSPEKSKDSSIVGYVATGYFEKAEAAGKPEKPKEKDKVQPPKEHIEQQEKNLAGKYYDNLWKRFDKNPALNETQKKEFKIKFIKLIKALDDAEKGYKSAFGNEQGTITIYENNLDSPDYQKALGELQKAEEEYTRQEFETLLNKDLYKEFEANLGKINSLKKIDDKRVRIDFDWEGWGEEDNGQVYIHMEGSAPYRYLKYDVYSTHLDAQEMKKETRESFSCQSIGELLYEISRIKFAHKEGKAGDKRGINFPQKPTELESQERDPSHRYSGIDLYSENENTVISKIFNWRKADQNTLRIYGQPGGKFAKVSQHFAFMMEKKSDGNMQLTDTLHDTLRKTKVPTETIAASASDKEIYDALKQFGEKMYQADLKKGANEILYKMGFNEKTAAVWENIRNQQYSTLKAFYDELLKIDAYKPKDINGARRRALGISGLKALPRGEAYEDWRKDFNKGKSDKQQLPKKIPDTIDEIKIYEKAARQIEKIRKIHGIDYTGVTVHEMVIRTMRYVDEM